MEFQTPLLVTTIVLVGVILFCLLLQLVAKFCFNQDTSKWYIVKLIKHLALNFLAVPFLIGALSTNNLVVAAVCAGLTGFGLFHFIIVFGHILISWIAEFYMLEDLKNLEDEELEDIEVEQDEEI